MLELARSVAFGHEGYTTRGDRSRRGSRAFDAVPGEKVVGEKGLRGAAGDEERRRRQRRLPRRLVGRPRVYVEPRRGAVRGESKGGGKASLLRGGCGGGPELVSLRQ